VAAGKEQIESVVKAGNEAATKQYEQVASLAKDSVEKTSEAVFKGYNEFTTLNKANADAVVQSSTIFSNGLESLSREMLDFTQKQMEANVETTKKLFGVKSLREFFDLQAEFTRQSFDKALAESAKVSEMSFKVANEALQPIQTQTNTTVEKVLKPAA
jgi:phasin family protein